nr:tail protein [Gammaproteobacteria bacterium]
MDLAIIFTSGNGFRFDIEQADYDLRTESGLRSAVMVSLFTDRRANADDDIPDGTADRRGCWQDSFLDNAGDSLGSRLWLLGREKEIPQTLVRAQEYAEEALQWLIDDGVARSVTVTAEHVRSGVLGLQIVIELVAGGVYEDVFDYNAEAA